MSHSRERKEKNCLNCGTLVQGRFCQVCGQENVEPKESLWALVSHFFNDITHFDGKFFQSIKNLFLRPGFLPEEYMKGRRASHLNPIRMYIFTSAVFFLLFFSFFYSEQANESILKMDSIIINDKTVDEIKEMDSLAFAQFTANINKNDGRPALPMTRNEFEYYKDTMLQNQGLHFTKSKYESRQQYDSLLKTGAKKHNWIERQLIYKEINLNEKYHHNLKEITAAFKSKLLHSLPQMLFLSLPLIALILKLIYFRRKQYYYVNHAIFSIYLYIFLFISMLLLFSIGAIRDYFHWGLLNIITAGIIIGMFIYEYKAMKYFYKQGRLKTVLKFLLLNFLFLIIILILFLFFIFFSFYNL